MRFLVKHPEMESRTGLGNGKKGESVFNGDRASVWKDEKALEVDGDDGCKV